jgi:hypothetical protein
MRNIVIMLALLFGAFGKSRRVRFLKCMQMAVLNIYASLAQFWNAWYGYCGVGCVLISEPMDIIEAGRV